MEFALGRLESRASDVGKSRLELWERLSVSSRMLGHKSKKRTSLHELKGKLVP
jgi:hypothetical protein